ncbi:hypothetical protein SAMN04487934_103168 [Eubacterium ruminantium]|nr:hypothetical protein SAMN04487934_103168 [Eubacterium ruminantium]
MGKKIKKNASADDLVKYTYRDSGQEFIMKRKMIRAIIIAILSMVALVVFIALYIAETHKVQEAYRRQYRKNIETLASDIEKYKNADGDFELRYRMLLSDISNANSFAFLLNDFVDEQKNINGLYTVFLKYPEQTKERLDEIKVFIDDILANLDKGYDEMGEFVESINKKGY